MNGFFAVWAIAYAVWFVAAIMLMKGPFFRQNEGVQDVMGALTIILGWYGAIAALMPSILTVCGWKWLGAAGVIMSIAVGFTFLYLVRVKMDQSVKKAKARSVEESK